MATTNVVNGGGSSQKPRCKLICGGYFQSMNKNNPFPGMNPFLERFWTDVYTKLIGYVGDAVAEQLPPGLKARSEEQVTLAEDGR